MKGWPDYTRVTGLVDNYDEYGQNYPVGIGDGAARLGSIKTYDMRGRVWWMDDFEAAVLHWKTHTAGAGANVALSTIEARNGNQSVALTSGTGSPKQADIQRIISMPVLKKLGIESHIALPTNFGAFSLRCNIYDGVNRSAMWIYISEATGQLSYVNDAAGWTNLSIPLCLSGDPNHFHDLKLVCDFESDEWLRILWDNKETSMGRESMYASADVSPCRLDIWMQAIGDGSNNTTTYIDDVIITTMEPR